MDVTNQVTIIGAGPAGLMLACTLARYGIPIRILDDRPSSTATGRADGLQPKTIETLKQLGLASSLLEKGVKVYDICFWQSTTKEKLHRTAREIHYPAHVVDLLDPHLLLIHQGMIEEVFIQDLRARGVEVQRNASFVRCETVSGSGDLRVEYSDVRTGARNFLTTQYLVGCDGAHSNVRKGIDGAEMEGEQSGSVWGILDAVIETDFPDLWSKTVVHAEKGAILAIPRERNMTRLYIELQDTAEENSREVVQDFVMERAEEIFCPYVLKWKRIGEWNFADELKMWLTFPEWFAVYRFGQRAAKRFSDEHQRVFIVGDAAHTHSPKAAQGMNVSMHDSFNLSWKLALSIKALARPSLLQTYTQERQSVALDLLAFDFEHANAYSAGDPQALADNFAQNVKFISGLAEYSENILNPGRRVAEHRKQQQEQQHHQHGVLKPGALLAPARVTRYIDANPVDLQLDIPLLGQFRIFFFTPDVHAASACLAYIFQELHDARTILGRISAAAQKATWTPHETEMDEYIPADRYIGASKLFTYALVTEMPKENFEIADLPVRLQESRWTIYVDDLGKDGESCTKKWVGELLGNEMAIVNVRPDGYVGSLGIYEAEGEINGGKAVKWLDEYYGGFLES
ncbi:hypothetical protein DSL72_005920 [Monilinia vaccinii-corymbosi]|uniref:FAD-binding domain-containing protein n=1 Tax=Monilinia vaccinii-corymbosi TaxID=61207 RepID=A0A8A3PH21_9HELO|nr:hypothetical protein DSL72_005920 [Monilinia vaccinii-corymbosi]